LESRAEKVDTLQDCHSFMRLDYVQVKLQALIGTVHTSCLST